MGGKNPQIKKDKTSAWSEMQRQALLRRRRTLNVDSDVVAMFNWFIAPYRKWQHAVDTQQRNKEEGDDAELKSQRTQRQGSAGSSPHGRKQSRTYTALLQQQ